jgi:hypothetical protein
MILEEYRLELARVAGVEAIEIVEAKAAGPVIERTDFAGLPRRCVVVLADPRRRIAVLLQNFSYRARALGNNAGVAVVASCQFSDDSRTGHVMIATREQSGARREHRAVVWKRV